MATDVVECMHLAILIPDDNHGGVRHVQAPQLVVTGLSKFFAPGNA